MARLSEGWSSSPVLRRYLRSTRSQSGWAAARSPDFSADTHRVIEPSDAITAPQRLANRGFIISTARLAAILFRRSGTRPARLRMSFLFDRIFLPTLGARLCVWLAHP